MNGFKWIPSVDVPWGCTGVHNVKVSSQKRFEVSAAAAPKGKEAQTPRHRAFASSKTNTTHIPMLDIIRPAHTVGMTTVSAPIGRREAFSISNWLFFFYNWNWHCRSVLRHGARARGAAATSRERIYVRATNVLLDCSLRFHSYFVFECGFVAALLPTAQSPELCSNRLMFYYWNKKSNHTWVLRKSFVKKYHRNAQFYFFKRFKF